jgi:hypothetical protein
LLEQAEAEEQEQEQDGVVQEGEEEEGWVEEDLLCPLVLLRLVVVAASLRSIRSG